MRNVSIKNDVTKEHQLSLKLNIVVIGFSTYVRKYVTVSMKREKINSVQWG